MLAIDGINNPDVIAINAASTALSLSDIPWNGPVGAVRMGMIDSELLINPTRKELQESKLNLVISATKRNLVVMLEGIAGFVWQKRAVTLWACLGNADGILLQDLQKAIKVGTKEAQHVVTEIENLQQHFGKPKRAVEAAPVLSEAITEAIRSLSEMRVKEVLQNYSLDKIARDVALSEIRANVLEKLRSAFPDADQALVNEGYGAVVKRIFRELIFENEIRCDGRHLDELRNISCQVDLYKPLHGSAVFTRGQTQVLCTVTLDSHESAMRMDPLSVVTR